MLQGFYLQFIALWTEVVCMGGSGIAQQSWWVINHWKCWQGMQKLVRRVSLKTEAEHKTERRKIDVKKDQAICNRKMEII